MRYSAMPEHGAGAAIAEPYTVGGAGCERLAKEVLELMDSTPSRYAPIYDFNMPATEKIETIAREIYGADGVDFDPAARLDIRRAESGGGKDLPDLHGKNAPFAQRQSTASGGPTGFRVNVRRVSGSRGRRLSCSAGRRHQYDARASSYARGSSYRSRCTGQNGRAELKTASGRN